MQADYQETAARAGVTGLVPVIEQRWSPRAYLADPVSDDELAQVFAAARLAPSCYNEQPWRFFTSTPASRERFLELLVEGNRSWAQSAPVIGFIVARKRFQRNGKPNFHAAFDSGAAWMAMSLQARSMGLYTHGMGGIHFEQVYDALDLDADVDEVICGFTIGQVDNAGGEALSERKPLAEIWHRI